MLPTQPNSGAAPDGVPPFPPSTATTTRAKRPWYRRWWAIALAAFFAAGVLANLVGGGDGAPAAGDAPTGQAGVVAAVASDDPAAEASAAAASESASAAASESAAAEAERKAEEEAERKAAEAKAKEEAEAKAAAEAKAQEEAEAKSKKEAAAEEKKRIDGAQPVSARDLSLIVKKPDAHVLETLVVHGEITQFDAATGECIFRANIGHTNMARSWDYDHNAIFMAGDGDADCPELDDFVADDEVRITATVVSAFSYDTQIGGSTTVPLFKVEKIALAK
ncbi:hypothetical protein ACQ3I4_12790 [Zafaria sp. Z1313]|uniref:hypothetical protein n=1 Tax=Zafaria sp. Z1313 TaxID=3423202 RepID=UPI003D301C05